jgi:hypothetical protein
MLFPLNPSRTVDFVKKQNLEKLKNGDKTGHRRTNMQDERIQ